LYLIVTYILSCRSRIEYLVGGVPGKRQNLWTSTGHWTAYMRRNVTEIGRPSE